MFSSPDQFASAGKALLESQIAAFAAMTAIATQSTEKILELNVAATKASTEDSIVAMQELLASKDPHSFYWRVSALAKAKAEKLAVYNSHLADVGAFAKAEFAKIADAQVSNAQEKVIAFVNSFGRHAPPVRKA